MYPSPSGLRQYSQVGNSGPTWRLPQTEAFPLNRFQVELLTQNMGPCSESRWRNHIHEGISHLVVYQFDQTLFMGLRSRSRDCFLNIELWR